MDLLEIANQEILKLKEENQILLSRIASRNKNVNYETMQNYHFGIRAFRQKQKLNQSDIAKRLGMEQSNYTRIESGKTKITVEMLIKISIILRVDICDLLKFKVII